MMWLTSPRVYAALVFGETWATRVQTTVGIGLYLILVLLVLNDGFLWGGPWG